MIKDKNVLLIGEDVGRGYGGVFGVSHGLYEEFGETQVIDTAIAENTILGSGIGTAIMGMKPIVEMMFEDFVAVCFDGILNSAAKLKFMSGDQYSLNLVVRLPGGSGGFGPQHSQCLENIFICIPGIKIVIPSNAYDAKGLLKTCINLGEPVLFFEHKKFYKTKMEVTEEEYSIPLGKGRIIREGKDITLVAISYMVIVAQEAAEELYDNYGIDVEIIDPRTLVPLDVEMIANSVKKTSRLVTLEESVLRGGIGAEITSVICEKYMDYLDMPIKKIASKNTHIAMTASLENAVVPNKNRVVQEIKECFGF
jgi:pyruvate/2-oxoglutarate/acetoin dehydrogenase E1 component